MDGASEMKPYDRVYAAGGCWRTMPIRELDGESADCRGVGDAFYRAFYVSYNGPRLHMFSSWDGDRVLMRRVRVGELPNRPRGDYVALYGGMKETRR